MCDKLYREARQLSYIEGGDLSGLLADGALVEVEPTDHQHQWLPWLTLPNGSSWTQCVPCGEQFQYDHEGVMPVPKEDT